MCLNFNETVQAKRDRPTDLVPEVSTDTDGCSMTGENGGEHVTRAEHGGNLLVRDGGGGCCCVCGWPDRQLSQRLVGALASRVQVDAGCLLRLAGPSSHVDRRQLCAQFLCADYNNDSTSIRQPFEGRSTGHQRSLRSQ